LFVGVFFHAVLSCDYRVGFSVHKSDDTYRFMEKGPVEEEMLVVLQRAH